MNKRVFFTKGNQKLFIQYVKEKLKIRWSQFSKKLNIKESTLSKSYYYELCSIPYELFKKMVYLTREDENLILKKYSGKIEDEKIVIGRKVFGEQKKEFSKINITFKNKSLNLDISKIGFSRYDLEKGIKLPNKLTPELAEEIGMHFGDGFLSKNRYDYRLKGNPKDEKSYYLEYIKPLFKEIYNLEINPKEFGESFGFEISSKALWEFKTKAIRIKPGEKTNIFYPETLKINDQKVLTSFIRGLFDTDGSLSFKTKYGYNTYYPIISITLISKELIKEVGSILSMLGFNPCIYLDGQYGHISLNGIAAFKRYEKLIGWRSQKNLKRVVEWKNRYPELNKKYMAVVA